MRGRMTATATSESLPPLLLPLVLYRISTSGEEATLHSTSRRLPVHVGWGPGVSLKPGAGAGAGAGDAC